MKRIVYSCNVCERERDEKDVKPYYPATEGITISKEKDEKRHICNECINRIHEYKEEEETNKK